MATRCWSGPRSLLQRLGGHHALALLQASALHRPVPPRILGILQPSFAPDTCSPHVPIKLCHIHVETCHVLAKLLLIRQLALFFRMGISSSLHG